MTFNQNLEFNQSQTLVMTPQLQQAIKLLQLSHLELQNFIQQELENNPFLDSGEYLQQKETETDKETTTTENEKVTALDANYDDVYDGDHGSDRADIAEPLLPRSHTISYDADNHLKNLENTQSNPLTLQQHIQQQIDISFTDKADKLIAIFLANALDENGYLQDSLEDMSYQLNISLEKLQSVLTACQAFEPVGIFSCSLQECLALQMKEKSLLDTAMQAFLENLELIPQKKFGLLARKCKVKKERVLEMLREVRQMNPRPGQQFYQEAITTVVPDVNIYCNSTGEWVIELNPEVTPNLNIHAIDKLVVEKVEKKSDRDFLREKQQSATWLLNTLEQRAVTILRVTREIVRQQDSFFEEGITGLRPMNLKNVSEILDIHESTVSRVTSNKYLRCPQGIFPMKFFFDSGVSNNIASGTVKDMIKTMVDAETANSILSDQDIMDKLEENGIVIARRTVAKYRESLKIPSSVRRRQMKIRDEF